MTTLKCKSPGCNEEFYAKKYCKKHYNQLRYTDTVRAEKPLGLCECGQKATTTMKLKCYASYERYNLCDACAELEREQAGAGV